MTKIPTRWQMPWILLRASSSALVSVAPTIAQRMTWGLLGAGSVCWGIVAPAIAQPVALDGSTNSTLLDALTGLPSDCSLSCLIQGTDQAGGNLFHSLSEFNVLLGVTVTFDGGGAERILSRVTGMNPSQIDGLLQVQGNADLFLLNPAGIVIGPTGRLDLQGSFISSTAEQLEFQNGDVFPALVVTPPILSVSVPSGLQFGMNNNAPFEVEGDVNRPPVWQSGSVGKTFALVADSSNASSFRDRSHEVSSGGMILANVGLGTFSVQLSETNQGWNFDFSNAPASRSIDIENSLLETLPTSPGGSINLYADLTLEDSDILLRSLGELPAGNLEYSGDSLQIDNSNIETIANLGGGDISLLSTGIFWIEDNSLLSVQSNGSGVSGNVNLNALGPNGIKIENSDIRSNVESGGGNVSISAPSQIILETGNLIASTLSDGANVTLSTNGNLILRDKNFISVNSGDGINSGTGGVLSIDTRQVRSIGVDTDIKVVGPAENFQTSITINPPYFGFGIPVFIDVERGNDVSEIQITELPLFPPPPTPVLPTPAPTPVPPPPTPLPIPVPVSTPTLIPTPPSAPTLLPTSTSIPTLIPTPPSAPTLVSTPPVETIPTPSPDSTPLVATPVMPQPSPEETEESDEDDLIWRPSSLFKQEEEALAVSSPYRVRRSLCAAKGYLLTEAYLAVTGRGGLPNSPGSLLLPSSPLEDLGSSDVFLGSKFSNVSLVQPEHPATEALLPSKLLEAGSWQMTSKGKIKLMANSQVSHVSIVQSCKLEREELG